MRAVARYLAAGLVGGVLACLGSAPPVRAYSALTHEAIVDSAWDDSIKPLLLKKYAGTTEEELRQARAYAYGGCILQDMGYYPFGNQSFTDLLHYVRSGDFAATLIEEAQPIEEYAFALGALEHYVADQVGHAFATNVVVPIEFPKLRRKYDSWVTYEDDPSAHLRIEFGFDVLQVARGRYTPEADHDFIGFEIAKKLIERTFYKVYGLKISDLLANEDLAIGTYRRTVSQLIPEASRIAWEMKKDELEESLPGTRREQVVYDLTPEAYEREWGNQYERPRWYDKLLAIVLRVVPKFGALQAVSVKPLTAQTEQLFTASFSKSVDRYRSVLRQLPGRLPPLANVNLDTGEPIQPGNYALADDAYATLVQRLRDHYFADVTPDLRERILSFYTDLNAPIATKRDQKAWQDLVTALAELRSTPAESLAAASSAPTPDEAEIRSRAASGR